MKVSKEKAAENRARILTAAARLFREHGLAGVGVDALAEAAGMTHGSLYSQFGSKERLAAEALSEALAPGDTRLLPEAGAVPGQDAVAVVVGRYLSPQHRDRPGEGCALAALGSEMHRGPASVRHAFTEGLRSLAARLAALLPRRRRQAPEDAALALLSALVGTLILARAVDDPGLSDRILAASARHLTQAA
ncbi:TetR/AcrR family transcriptional regulator [Plastoroseomonas hellenica]|uniref:TetR/AcrR family transcriptional regulator n=1 Tax=Plastoroseomonas hellenica TaxID=2687306 RepID=UPI001BAC1AFC|nr:helix-turn-helix transcriptional regulator [Plastoroseomonas hellenica]